MQIIEIKGRRALREFVQFQLELYRDCAAFVPPMIDAELDCLDPKKNPAFEFCKVAFFAARRDRKMVGRIAGIVNYVANQRTGRKSCRFCYCDFIDDMEVSRALFDAVGHWAREQGMEELVGPMGLTDLDYEGALVEGYDQLATTVELYNYPYYLRHYEAYGMQPQAYWNGYHIKVPAAVPAKHLRVAEMVKHRYNLQVLKIEDGKELVARYGKRLFELYNLAYAPLYGFVPLTQKQIDYYINLYLPQVRLDLIRLVVDSDDNLLAFGIATPSLSHAQQRAHGKMWPLGWIHLAKAMYLTRNSTLGRLLDGGTDIADLLLIGVHPCWQGRGINALIFTELIEQFVANGYTDVETNNELDSNMKAQNMWGDFEKVRHKRRCTYQMPL